MERSEILATMGELKLYGMKAAFDEIMATAVKRQHDPRLPALCQYNIVGGNHAQIALGQPAEVTRHLSEPLAVDAGAVAAAAVASGLRGDAIGQQVHEARCRAIAHALNESHLPLSS